MENLYTQATKYTLEIDFNTNGMLRLSGRSFPENTFEYYSPMIAWLKEYLNSTSQKTTFELEIIYCNSSSTMLFFDICDILKDYKENITINWYYDEENDNMEEMGEDIASEYPELDINLLTIEQ
jgi:hypothetical protein